MKRRKKKYQNPTQQHRRQDHLTAIGQQAAPEARAPAVKDREGRHQNDGGPVTGAAFRPEIKAGNFGIRPHLVEQADGDGGDEKLGAGWPIFTHQKHRQRCIAGFGPDNINRNAGRQKTEIIGCVPDRAGEAERLRQAGRIGNGFCKNPGEQILFYGGFLLEIVLIGESSCAHPVLLKAVPTAIGERRFATGRTMPWPKATHTCWKKRCPISSEF